MIFWSYLLVETVAFLLAVAVAREAYQRGAAYFTTLLVSMVFGFAIELFFVTQYAGYSYGDFMVDIIIQGHNVPLWVAAGWGTIIFVAMQATDRMGLPWYLAAPVDGLLAVSLDLTLDPVADGLGWWNWSRPSQFFGVPFDNFIGWVLIVGTFSFFSRLGFKLLAKHGLWKDLLVPVMALVPAVLSVAGAQVALEKVFYPWLGEPLSFFILASVLSLAALPALLRAKTTEKPPWYLAAIPLSYHGLMVVLLLATGISSEHPELLLLSPLALLVSAVAFLHPRRSTDAKAVSR